MVTYSYRIQADPVDSKEWAWDITVYVHSYGDENENCGWRVAHTQTVIVANRMLGIRGFWRRIAVEIGK